MSMRISKNRFGQAIFVSADKKVEASATVFCKCFDQSVKRKV